MVWAKLWIEYRDLIHQDGTMKKQAQQQITAVWQDRDHRRWRSWLNCHFLQRSVNLDRVPFSLWARGNIRNDHVRSLWELDKESRWNVTQCVLRKWRTLSSAYLVILVKGSMTWIISYFLYCISLLIFGYRFNVIFQKLGVFQKLWCNVHDSPLNIWTPLLLAATVVQWPGLLIQ